MILKNKRTRETLELTLHEFKIRFAKEIKRAFESYKQTELAKPYFKINGVDILADGGQNAGIFVPQI